MRIPRPLGTAQFLMAWAMPWRPASRVRARGSRLPFYVHHRDLIGRHIFKYGVHEPILTRWMESYLDSTPQRGLFVDVGANLGWHAVHAARHRSVEQVIAFEPDAFNVSLLERNLAANRITNCTVIASAVGDRRDQVRFYNYKSSNRGRHSMIKDYGFGSRMVEMVDLDSALDAAGLGERRVLILKIDVEGFEPAVIAGAARMLSRTDAVVLEYSPDLGKAGGLSAHDMADRLHGAGFVPHRIDDDSRTHAITIETLRNTAGQMDLIWLRRA